MLEVTALSMKRCGDVTAPRHTGLGRLHHTMRRRRHAGTYRV